MPIAQQPKCEVIHILLGGHGNHLKITDYEKDYKKIIKYITEKYNDKKFILASFTPLRKTDNLKETQLQRKQLKNTVLLLWIHTKL